MNNQKLTIFTLMTGKWYALEGYLQSLFNLKFDPSNVEIFWLTNAQESFINILNDLKPRLEKHGFSVRIEVDQSIKPFLLPKEEQYARYQYHLYEYCALYNLAWSMFKTDDVLIIQDDMFFPSNTFLSLKKSISKHGKAAVVGTACFDFFQTGHKKDLKSRLCPSRLRRVSFVEDGELKSKFSLAAAKNPWGVRPVDAVSFQCAWIRRSRLDKEILEGMPFLPQGEEEYEHIFGYDYMFCLEVLKQQKLVLCDFDVRCLKFFATGESI